jgi:predicted acyl esterase
MGADEWRCFSNWPPEGAERVQLRLRPSNAEDPTAIMAALTASSVESPVPTIGGRTFFPGYKVGANSGPRSLEALHAHKDVHAFISEPLDDDIEIMGTVTCRLKVTAAGPTPVVVKLATLDSTGAPELLCEGSSYSRTGDGNAESINVDLGSTSVRVAKGMRLCAYLATSDFPRLEDGPRTLLNVCADEGPVLELDVLRLG